MHTVDVLEEAVRAAQMLGYRIRQEWLDGSGGLCEYGGQRWIFIDLSQTTAEQLEQVLVVLRSDSRSETWPMSGVLRRLITRRPLAATPGVPENRSA